MPLVNENVPLKLWRTKLPPTMLAALVLPAAKFRNALNGVFGPTAIELIETKAFTTLTDVAVPPGFVVALTMLAVPDWLNVKIVAAFVAGAPKETAAMTTTIMIL